MGVSQLEVDDRDGLVAEAGGDLVAVFVPADLEDAAQAPVGLDEAPVRHVQDVHHPVEGAAGQVPARAVQVLGFRVVCSFQGSTCQPRRTNDFAGIRL